MCQEVGSSMLRNMPASPVTTHAPKMAKRISNGSMEAEKRKCSHGTIIWQNCMTHFLKKVLHVLFLMTLKLQNTPKNGLPYLYIDE